jgi:acetyl-CoA acetyltransferase
LINKILFLSYSIGLNDGAAALILCSNRIAQLKQQIPLAKIISWAQTGIDPLVMVHILFV